MRQRIIESTVRSLKPPESGNRIVYDREVPGFGVRITANHAIRFVLEYSIHGRQRRYTIGPWPELTATAAREKARRLRAGIADKGIDPLAERQELRAAPTIADLADRYLDEHARPHKAETSVAEDESLLRRVIRPELARHRVTSVQRTDVERLRRRLRSTPYRANRALALLSKMLNLAIGWGLRGDNPCKGVKRYPEDRRERWLRTEDIARLNAALDRHSNPIVANAIKLCLLTGARRGEVLKAKWSEFDLERGVWTKPSHHTKQRKTEHLPLNDPTLALLRNMKQQAAGEHVFPGKNSGQALTDIKKSWAVIRAVAGIGDDVRLHDLRHTYASHLVSSGVSLHIVGKLLGHTRPETTQRYAHLADEALREATGRFGAIVGGASQERQRADIIPLRTADQ